MSTYQLLTAKLKDTLVYARPGRTAFSIENVEALEAAAGLKDHTLYLASEENTRELLRKKDPDLRGKNVLFLVSRDGDSDGKASGLQTMCEKNDISVIITRDSLQELYFHAAKVCQYYLQLSEKVEELSLNHSLQELLDGSSEYLGEGMLLVTTKGSLVCESGAVEEESRRCLRASLKEILRGGASSGYLDMEGSQKQKCLYYVKLYRSGQEAGVLTVQQQNQVPHDYEKFFRKMVPVFTEQLLRELESKKSVQAKFDHIWKDMIEGRYSSDQDIKNTFIQAGMEIKTFYRLIVIRTDYLADKIRDIYREIRPQIRQILPGCLITLYSGTIVVIDWDVEWSYDYPGGMEQMDKLLKASNCRGCLSGIARNLTWASLMYELCLQTLRLQQMLKLPDSSFSSLVDFNTYSPYLMIDMCAQFIRNNWHTKNIMLLIHPAVINLYRYDLEHNTNLEEVLYYYLINHRSLELTAKNLFMHRNTIVNKIRKIRELTPVDMDSPEVQTHLIISHYLLNYCLKVIDSNYVLKDQHTVI